VRDSSLFARIKRRLCCRIAKGPSARRRRRAAKLPRQFEIQFYITAIGAGVPRPPAPRSARLLGLRSEQRAGGMWLLPALKRGLLPAVPPRLREVSACFLSRLVSSSPDGRMGPSQATARQPLGHDLRH
jgi:hypothetical protein